MTDPNYKQNLIRFFKSKGFKYKDIDAWMERNNIDGKIAEAKANKYRENFAGMVKDNNLLDAGFELAQMAGIDPKQASALMSLYPSYGRQWQNTVDLENMKIKNDMMMNNYAQKLSMQQQAKIQAMEMKKRALMAYGIPESAATAMAYAGFNPYGRSGNSGRSGTGGTGGTRGGRSGSGRSGNGSSSKEKDANFLIKLLEKREEWEANHPNTPFPLEDTFKEQYEKVKGIGDYDPDDYYSTMSQATKIMEANQEVNSPYNQLTSDELLNEVSMLGGFGPEIAEQLRTNGAVDLYGRNNAPRSLNPNNAEQAYSLAQRILNENEGKVSSNELYELIKSQGGYCEAIADEYKNDGTLDEYAS